MFIIKFRIIKERNLPHWGVLLAMEMEWKRLSEVTVLTAQELVDQDGKRKAVNPCDVTRVPSDARSASLVSLATDCRIAFD